MNVFKNVFSAGSINKKVVVKVEELKMNSKKFVMSNVTLSLENNTSSKTKIRQEIVNKVQPGKAEITALTNNTYEFNTEFRTNKQGKIKFNNDLHLKVRGIKYKSPDGQVDGDINTGNDDDKADMSISTTTESTGTILTNGKKVSKYIYEEDGVKYQNIEIGRAKIVLNTYIDKIDETVLVPLKVMHFQIGQNSVHLKISVSVVEIDVNVHKLDKTDIKQVTQAVSELKVEEPKGKSAKELAEEQAKIKEEERMSLIENEKPQVEQVKSSELYKLYEEFQGQKDLAIFQKKYQGQLQISDIVEMEESDLQQIVSVSQKDLLFGRLLPKDLKEVTLEVKRTLLRIKDLQILCEKYSADQFIEVELYVLFDEWFRSTQKLTQLQEQSKEGFDDFDDFSVLQSYVRD